MGFVEQVQMRQLAEARCGDDDWTGLRDQAERRKRQTRLALRAYRKRKSTQKEAMLGHKPTSELKQTRTPETKDHICFENQSAVHHTTDPFIPPYLGHNGQVIPGRILYPISRDHLLPLIEYNVFRASLTNLLILGHLHLMDSSSCSFSGSIPVFPSPYQGDNLPVSLRPTLLQQSTSHPDWIDLFPSPRMRDNAIRSQHLFTNLELCADLLGGIAGTERSADSGLLVWSNPWEPEGWELTEGFIRKWGFLVQGCTDLLQSTNRWREIRGEERLVWELI